MDTATLFRLGALSGALAVALGAFGAHGLKPHLSEYQLGIWEKAVLYQFVHTFALMLIAVLMLQQGVSPTLRTAGALFAVGILLFSGSLYVLALRDLLPFPAGWAGPITPIGGLCFIAGWITLLYHSWTW